MSLALMNINMCSVCKLHFSTMYDLIAHIEYTHIPLIEEEQRQKSSQTTDDNRTAPNVPLSYVCRVFRTPYRPTPSKPETFRLNWCHYRKKPPPAPLMPAQPNQMPPGSAVSGLLTTNTGNLMNPPNPRSQQNYMDMRGDARSTVVPGQLPPHPQPPPVSLSQSLSQHHPPSISNHSSSLPTVSSTPQLNLDIPHEPPQRHEIEDLRECAPNDPESRYKCSIIDCPARYKNPAGLRHHLQLVHRINFDDKMSESSNGGSYGDELHGQLPNSPSKPHKCQFCSKRYKTPAGLANHVNQAHQKTAGGYPQSQEQPSSPTVLAQIISRAAAEQREQSQQHSLPSHQQRPLPVALAPSHHQMPQSQSHYHQSQSMHNQQYTHQNSQPPLPVRSIGSYSQQTQLQRQSNYSSGVPTSNAMQQGMHQPPLRRSHISHTQMAQQILQQGQLQQQMSHNNQPYGMPMQGSAEMPQGGAMQRHEMYQNRPTNAPNQPQQPVMHQDMQQHYNS